jgi:WD40 repeat protein
MEEFNRREAKISENLLKEEINEDLEYVKVSGSLGKGIKLRQIFKGHSNRIHRISWSPDGRFLASSSDDKTVRIWSDTTGECISVIGEQEEIKHCAWSPDSQNLVYGGNKQIRLWNVKDNNSIDLFQNDYLRLDSVEFSPNGKMLVLAYGTNTIQLLETSGWKDIGKRAFEQRSKPRINIQWHDDGDHLLVNPSVGLIHLLSAQTLLPVKEVVVPGEHDAMYGFSFLYTAFEDKIAIAEEKKPIRIFDLASGHLEREFNEATSYISGLVFSPDGTLLVSWSHDNSVNFWEVESGRKLARIHEYSCRVIEPVYPCFHPVKPSLVTFCDKRQSMRVWDIDYKELFG